MSSAKVSGGLSGVFAPVVTPFGEDHKADTAQLAEHCRWLLDKDCGLAVFGTNSEANSITVEERLDILDALVGADIDPGRMMPGTGCCAIGDTVRLSAKAAQLGCGGVLMLPPFYYKGVSDEGLYRAFAETIDRVGDARLKIYLYHIPPIAQVPLPLSLIERLLRDYPDTVVGIKDSGGDWTYTKSVLDAFPGFRMFVGSEGFLLENMRNGGVGCISAIANVNPGDIDALYRNWQQDGAADLQADLDRLREMLQAYPMIPALKAVVGRSLGNPVWARVRPPLVELDEAQQAELFATLDAAGFAMDMQAAA